MDIFWKDKRALITGASGFLGSQLSIRLLKEGAQVIGIRKEKAKESFLTTTFKKVKFSGIEIIKSDIIDFKSMLRIFKRYKPDVCLHLAAQPIVGIANKYPLSTFEVNIKGTWNILEIARICNTKAIIVASGYNVYGEHEKLPYTENTSLLAMYPYDASKACADILSRTYAHTYNLPIAVTRCANIYGPGDFNFSRIIPGTIRSLINGEAPIIRSDGAPLRDYIYIKDAVNAYIALANKLYLKEIKFGEAFNLGTGEPISVLNLAKKIIRLSGKNNLKPLILGKGKINGEIDKQYLSSKKAEEVLGWKAKYTIQKGLKETYEWYKHYSISHLPPLSKSRRSS